MRWVRALAGVVVALAGPACSSGAPNLDAGIPVPPPTVPTAPTTTVPDFSSLSLPTVAGRQSIKVSMGPGQATITGSVLGPAGPVPGASVHAERIVGDNVATADLLTAPDGTWTIAHVLGGRFRIRAWRAPDLSLTTPLVFYLGNTENRSVSLSLLQYQGMTVVANISPKPPVIGQPAYLAVEVANQVVDAVGVVRGQPVPAAQVQLTPVDQWTVSAPNPLVTGADGTATWPVVCLALGAQSLIAVVNTTNSVPFTVPACSAPPTTVPPPASSTVPGAPAPTVKPTTTVG